MLRIGVAGLLSISCHASGVNILNMFVHGVAPKYDGLDPVAQQSVYHPVMSSMVPPDKAVFAVTVSLIGPSQDAYRFVDVNCNAVGPIEYGAGAVYPEMVTTDLDVVAHGRRYTTAYGGVIGPNPGSYTTSMLFPNMYCEVVLEENYRASGMELLMTSYVLHGGRAITSRGTGVPITPGNGGFAGDSANYVVDLIGPVTLTSDGAQDVVFLKRGAGAIPLHVLVNSGEVDGRYRYNLLSGGQMYRLGQTFTWNTTEVSIQPDPSYNWPAGQAISERLSVTVTVP